jgi:hypothetical protein
MVTSLTSPSLFLYIPFTVSSYPLHFFTSPSNYASFSARSVQSISPYHIDLTSLLHRTIDTNLFSELTRNTCSSSIQLCTPPCAPSQIVSFATSHHLSQTMSTVPSAIDEALERLVDTPTDRSSSLTLLAKIEQASASLLTMAEHNEYTEYRTAITVFNINVHLKSRRHILFLLLLT